MTIVDYEHHGKNLKENLHQKMQKPSFQTFFFFFFEEILPDFFYKIVKMKKIIALNPCLTILGIS